MSKTGALITLPLILLGACKSGPPPASSAPAPGAAATLERAAFNRAASQLDLPLFWYEDEDGMPAPDEIAVLWGHQTTRDAWVAQGAFTERYAKAQAQIVARMHAAPASDARLSALEKELAQGRPTLLRTDLRSASEADKSIVRHIMEAAVLIEHIHALQNGVHGMMNGIPAEDTLSRATFRRNQGPWCEAPKTEKLEACAAVSPTPPKLSGLYPQDLQREDPKFCDSIAAMPNAKSLLHQFTAVRRGPDGKLVAVPYPEAFPEQMKAVADKLRSAAGAITGDDEAAFKTYLLAAAKAFADNQWEPADEAWAKMNADNSKWYLRIGPDETYFEPCNRKAGFHVSFARIDQSSRVWQQRLDPVKGKMEQAIAALAQAPYAARKVDFDLPDFIHIIVNAGDARRALGATVGQSLPNWGPVANEGRGRTVAMMNVTTDVDSVATTTRQAQSILCPQTYSAFDPDPDALTMSTVLHEAAHNLGPAHEYKVDGKTDDEIFGGPLASVLEELKAETASYYYADWLANEGIITKQAAKKAHVRDLIWGFGHIARGLRDAEGKPKTYSFVAAIQTGYWLKQGVATWMPQAQAANGEDVGCLELDLETMPTQIEKLMSTVAQIKGKGQADVARALVEEMVNNPKGPLLKTVAQRWQREPEASLVYSVDL